jgi:hypothetical protein
VIIHVIIITTRKGLRQGDSLACLLFNLALEKFVRNAGIEINGTIFYKSVQLLSYADDIDIIARSQTALKAAFLSLERAAGEMGLKINEEKPKYLTTTVNNYQHKHFQIENFNSEIVQSFTYLGFLVNVNNDNSTGIKKRRMTGAFFWVTIVAGEVYGIFILAELGVIFLIRHCLLKYIFAHHFRTFNLMFLY